MRKITIFLILSSLFVCVIKINNQQGYIDRVIKFNVNKLDLEKLQRCTVVIDSETAFGSGSFISSSGLILTAGHVVDMEPNEVTLFDRTKYEVVSSWKSDKYDVGFIKIDVNVNEYLEFSYVEPRVGDIVYHCGASDSRVFFSTVVKGIVSFVDRGDEDNIQTDLDVYGGCSGGPLVDKDGKIIGVMVAKLTIGTMNFSENLEHIKESLREYYAQQSDK